MADSPAPIPSDAEILIGIHEYLSENQAFPNQEGEVGMTVFVQNYLLSNTDPQLVRQRMDTLQREYMATRHMLQGPQTQPLWPSLPRERQRIYALCHRVWYQSHLSDSDTTSADETSFSVSGPPVFHNSSSLDESSSIHGRQDVDHQSSPVDQTNQATSSRAGIHHSYHSDHHTPTPNRNPSAAENTPEKSYSADQSNTVSSAEYTPGTSSSAVRQSSINIVSSDSPNRGSSKDSASSSRTRRRLFEDLNQQGGDTTAASAQDINILTKMVAYSEANNEVYPNVSAERLSEFVRNWLHSDADPGEVGKRIQELREMYAKYLMNNNHDEAGKPVYSDSPDDRLLLDLSKKLWHHEFGNPNDDSAGGNSSGDKS
ncbi:hypothetical protein ACH5RR_009513 [Cinchona calisaya]|uniref:Glabrous enhancer-binding protein-like DBD domain-containing protein n=1 Tax=Cinchona calisaya TaxID=153742 RepID=A0ABD3AEE4_9GENT